LSHSTSCSGGSWCESADALLGVPGVHITSVTKADAGLIVHVETDQTINGCPDCGVAAVGHGRRQIRVHDIPYFGPAPLIWAKRVWRCPDEHCPRKVFSEEHPLAGKRAILTSRAVRSAVDALEKYDASLSALAHQLGVSWRALWKGVEAEATRRIGRPERLAGIDALGVDEHVVRREALLFWMEVRDLHRLVVAAAG
jgi:transposase